MKKTLCAALACALAPLTALADEGKIKVGMMLPTSGVFGEIGKEIINGFQLYVQEQKGRLGSKTVELVILDDESDPAKAVENATKLVKKEKVDVIVGTVHSGVQMGLSKVARDTGTLLIVPNAGTNEITGQLCAPNIFRVSFSNWQQGFATGKYAATLRKPRFVAISMDYTAGKQYIAGFKEAYEQGGGQILKELYVPLTNIEFQPYLTEIASLKPDGVYAFFAGAAAPKFLKEFAQAGIKKQAGLFGPGFLTETLEGLEGAAEGVETTLMYGDGLDIPKNVEFRQSYQAQFKSEPEVYAVFGYDAAQLLAIGIKAVDGNLARKNEMIAAMEKAEIDSPRGKFRLSKSHNPIQTFYVRRVEGGKNKVIGVAVENLEDPALGCKL